MKYIFFILLSIQILFATDYTITSNTGTYTTTLNPSDIVFTFKQNTTTNEYELWIYNKDTNQIETKYDINTLPQGTIITNPVTNYKYIILYDNINFKNIIKKII